MARSRQRTPKRKQQASSQTRSLQGSRPKFAAVSEEMKAWSAAMVAEVAGWPRVSTRPMFGFTALYRGKNIFAILPRTRGTGSPSSMAFKLDGASPRVLTQLRKDPGISTTIMRARRWFVFELSSNADMREAVGWLNRAYEAAS